MKNPWIEKNKVNGDPYWKNTETNKVSATKPEWSPPIIQRGGSINYKIHRGGNRLRKTMKLFHNTLPKMKFTCANKPCKLNKSKKGTKQGTKHKSKRRNK